jgi:hypothetical protein
MYWESGFRRYQIKMTPHEPYKLEISLSQTEEEIATDYQINLGKLLNRHISLEEAFKIAIFHTLHINNIKLAILKSYEDNKSNITGENTDKTKNNHISKTNTKKQSKLRRKKRVIPFKESQVEQAKLGGFE